MNGPFPCPTCPQVFDQPGTVIHGQPGGLWALLEHQAQGCPEAPNEPNRSAMLKNADEVRAYMEAVHRTQAAFITPDGRHVLVQIDRDDDIGLIDPDSLISWIFLNRRDLDIWPLAALNLANGSPGVS